MIIDSSWVEISTTSCVLQKAGTRPLRLKYSNGQPTNSVGSIYVGGNDILTLYAVPSKTLWAAATKGPVSVAVEEVSIGATLPTDSIRGGWATYFNGDPSTISVAANTPTQITMDADSGQIREEFLPTGTTRLWNSAASQFDFSSLSLGDMVDLRMDGTLTSTGNNESFLLELILGVGSAGEVTIPVASGNRMFSGTSNVSRYNGFFIGSQNVIDYPAELRVTTTDPASVRLADVYLKVLRTSQ